jgi:cation-transporting ATPase 13A3/4/5
MSVSQSTVDSGNESSTESTSDRYQCLVWRDFDTEQVVSTSEFQNVYQRRHTSPLELAVTGSAWDFLCKSGDADTYLLSIRVWGRMSPEQKVDVVKRHMDHGLIVAMCGDGGNDCGALNAAHVGLALSEAEASIVAPFSSKTKSIRSCVDLIAEGRSALASSFSGFKFLIMYGLTMVCQGSS